MDESSGHGADQTWSSADGLVLYALGLSYRSMTLTLLLLLFALLPLVLLFKLPLEPAAPAAALQGDRRRVLLRHHRNGIMAITLGLLRRRGRPAHEPGPHALPPGVVMAVIVGRRNPVAQRRTRARRSALRDGLMLWTAQWVHTGGNALPLFVLSFYHSSDGIGYYVFALSVSVQIITLLSWNLSHAFTPIFSRIQDEPDRLASAYMRSAGAVTGVAISG